MKIGRRSSTALALVAMLAIAACTGTDLGIATRVRAKLAIDGKVRHSRIEVAAHDRVVTLTGNIDSVQAKERALAVAKATKGVVRVQDMIEVRRGAADGDAPDPDRTIGVRIDDAATTMRVKGRLLEDPQVKGLDIDVDTRSGVVFLTGTVGSEKERDRAVQVTRETKGVADVRANLAVGK